MHIDYLNPPPVVTLGLFNNLQHKLNKFNWGVIQFEVMLWQGITRQMKPMKFSGVNMTWTFPAADWQEWPC